MCVDRDQIIDVVFSGYASKVESIVGHISTPREPDLGPLKYNCAAANRALDKLGLSGLRRDPRRPRDDRQVRAGGAPDEYEIVTPTSTDFNVNREFAIVKAASPSSASR